MTVRILQITGIACRGGVESAVMNWYRKIDREKFQFDFLIDGYGPSVLDEEIARLGGMTHKTAGYRKNIIATMLDVYRTVKTFRYDIVHCHMSTLTPFYLFPAWLAGAKVRIAHSHGGGSPEEGVRYLLKLLLRPLAGLFATDLAACSRNAGLWMFGARKEKTVQIFRNAIDLTKFCWRPERRESLRRKLALEGRTAVGHAGRFMTPKNHRFLLEIFEEIKKQDDRAILLLAGDGPLRASFEEKVRKLGLQDSVVCLGARADVADLMQAMDILIFPSLYEGLGMAVVEAAACGLPCLASCAVPEEAVFSPVGRRISLQKSAWEWARYAEELLKQGRQDGRKHVRAAGFDIDTQIAELERVYSQYAERVRKR